MGFNFDKSSQDGGGGGKIRRKAKRIASTRGGDGLQRAFVSTANFSPPTSPQWWMNNVYSVIAGASWQYVSASDTTTLSTTIGSTYWVDLIWLYASGYFTEIRARGETLTDIPPALYNNNGTVLDVYGYGISITAYQKGYFGTPQSNYLDILFAPMVPNTKITESGSVVWPPALSGRSVARDI